MEIIFILFVIILIAVIGFSVLNNKRDRELLQTVTKLYRGTGSERNMVLKLLKHGIPAQTIFHDLYVKQSNGKYSQIDIAVATKVGIIVFEIKDYSGWIFGKGNQTKWTQVLAYGREKYRFYNPIMQNNGHILALRKQLKQLEQIPFYSIIVFYGNCELKDIGFIPNETYLVYPERVLNVIDTIINNNDIANFSDKREVIRTLKNAVQNGDNEEIKIKHIENIKNMLDKDRIYN
jgi:polyhydroxyalkanoate synthesis regulator phasin